MRLVVADTSPINYLVLIGEIHLLPILFEKVLLPGAVHKELTSARTPPLVRQWISVLPGWLEVRESNLDDSDILLASIDIGERAAIQLAVAVQADLVLMDDRKGVHVAERKGLTVTGTLGVLDLAAERGIVDFAEAVRELEKTSFRRPDQLLRILLAKHRR